MRLRLDRDTLLVGDVGVDLGGVSSRQDMAKSRQGHCISISDLCTAVRRTKHPLEQCIKNDANGAFDHPWSSCTFGGLPVRRLLGIERDVKFF